MRLHLALLAAWGCSRSPADQVVHTDDSGTPADTDTDTDADTDSDVDADTDTDDSDDSDDPIDTATPDAACRVVTPPPPSSLPPTVPFDAFDDVTLTGRAGDGLGYMAIGLPDIDGSGYGEVVASYFGGSAANPCDLIYWPHANSDASALAIPSKYCGLAMLRANTSTIPQNTTYMPYPNYTDNMQVGNRYLERLAVRYEPGSQRWRAFVGSDRIFAVDMPISNEPNIHDDVTAMLVTSAFHNYPLGHQIGDFNGDGWLDFVNRGHHYGIPGSAFSAYVPVVSLGVVQLLYVHGTGVAVSLGPLRDFRDSHFVYDYALIPDEIDHQRPYRNSGVVGDFNGDGLTDIVFEWRPEAGLTNLVERDRLGDISGLVLWDTLPPTTPMTAPLMTPPFGDLSTYSQQSSSLWPVWTDVSDTLRLRLTCGGHQPLPTNLGDIDGDGRDDLWVESNSGIPLFHVDAAFLITDFVSGPRSPQNIVDRAQAIFVSGDPIRDFTGGVVVALDDINNNGYPEIAIHDHYRATLYVFDGPHYGTRRFDQADFWITTMPSVSHLDSSADLDGDGKRDLVIGSWGARGAVHVVTAAAMAAAIP